MAAALSPDFAAYLASHHVMTLATQGADGPWAAAVFYAWVDGALIFLSSPNSRHGANLAQDGRCAATIQEDYSDWRQIKGIQLEGRVERLHGDDAARARAAYAEKFPIAGPQAMIPPAIAEALARVSWYRLQPTRIHFIDNARGFGHRDEIAVG